jgi:hypothetical protein
MSGFCQANVPLVVSHGHDCSAVAIANERAMGEVHSVHSAHVSLRSQDTSEDGADADEETLRLECSPNNWQEITSHRRRRRRTRRHVKSSPREEEQFCCAYSNPSHSHHLVLQVTPSSGMYSRTLLFAAVRLTRVCG